MRNYIHDDKITLLYRVQGGLSKPTIRIDADRFSINLSDHLFVSQSAKHHDYFLNKRMMQILHREISDSKNLPLHKNWSKSGVIDYFCNATLSYKKNIRLDSVNMGVCMEFMNCVFENSLSTDKKAMDPNKRWLIKRVDERRSTGSYHLSSVWLKLFRDMILFVEYRSLDDTRVLYDYLKKNGYKEEFLSFVELFSSLKASVIFNKSLGTQNNVDVIVDDIRQIIEKRAYLDGSLLSTRPQECIDRLVASHEDAKKRLSLYRYYTSNLKE